IWPDNTQQGSNIRSCRLDLAANAHHSCWSQVTSVLTPQNGSGLQFDSPLGLVNGSLDLLVWKSFLQTPSVGFGAVAIPWTAAPTAALLEDVFNSDMIFFSDLHAGNIVASALTAPTMRVPAT